MLSKRIWVKVKNVTYGFFILFHFDLSLHNFPLLLLPFGHKLIVLSLQLDLLVLSYLILLFLVVCSEFGFLNHLLALPLILNSKIFFKLQEFLLDLFLPILANLLDHPKSILCLLNRRTPRRIRRR